MSKRNPKPLNLNEFLPYRLSIVTNKVSRSFSALYSGRFNLTVSEWRIMAVLGQYPGISAEEVCHKTEMDKVTVSRAVTKLLDKGYLDREFSEADKRRSVLGLSNSGYSIYTRIIPLARKFEAKLVRNITSEELSVLNTLLDKLNK